MNPSIPDASERSGLLIVADVVIAPRSAFEALRVKGRWLWALLVTWVLGGIGSVLEIPANHHVMVAALSRQAATDPNIASLSPEKQHQILAVSDAIGGFAWLYYPIIVLVGCLVTAVILLIANAIFKGEGSFGKLFAMAVNIAIVQYGIGYLIYGILATLRGPDAFSSQTDLFAAMPSLGWLAGGAGPKVVSFLSATTNPFVLWSIWLLGLGFSIVARVRAGAAYGTAVAIVLLSGLVAAAGAK